MRASVTDANAFSRFYRPRHNAKGGSMNLREEMIRDVSGYLREHFPGARIAAKTDALTKSEVFTVQQGADARHVEVTERWFDQDDDVLLLPNAIRVWGLADAIRQLPAGGTLRLKTTGIERVS
jgi:hypothetical protein